MFVNANKIDYDYDHVLKEIAQDALGFLFHNLSELKAEEEFVHSPNVDFLEAFLKCQHLLSDTEGEKEVGIGSESPRSLRTTHI